MKIIKKILGLATVFLITICNTCYADVVWTEEQAKNHGMQYRPGPEHELIVNYILIGILVLVVAVCTMIIIRRIMKNKKEKQNDNNKQPN